VLSADGKVLTADNMVLSTGNMVISADNKVLSANNTMLSTDNWCYQQGIRANFICEEMPYFFTKSLNDSRAQDFPRTVYKNGQS
jgi:hypothetical protein